MVSVAIAVTSSGTFRSVQYHGEVFKSFSGIHIFQFGKHGPVQQAGADYENGAVRPFSIICASATMSTGGQSMKI